jgi:hypothetical protein
MTPKRLALVRIASAFGTLALIVAGIVLVFAVPRSPIGPMFVLVAVVARFAVRGYLTHLQRLDAHRQYELEGQRWWFNRRTRTVEEGERPHGAFRDGPYPTREAAERAPQIARGRAAEWNAEH